MTFFIPPVFLFGNNANRFHNDKEKKSEYKTAAETEIQIENRRIKRIVELEEENQKLKEENKKLKYVIDSVMEKAGIEYIRLADWDVFTNPKNKLQISDTIQIDILNGKQ